MLKRNTFNSILNHPLRRLERAFNKSPKKVFFVMMGIVSIGIIYTIFRRPNKEYSEQFIDVMSKYDTMDVNINPFGKIPSFGNFKDIMEMDDKLNEILDKDSLTAQDSIFLINMDAKLNQMINEEIKY